jgi:hypothetical protein
MKNTTHFYSLKPQWQRSFADGINAELIDDKIIVIPEAIGTGHTYFIEVAPGISVLFSDYTLTSPIRMSKLTSEEEFYIFDYNLTEFGDLDDEINDAINLDLTILNNQVENAYEPAVNQKTFGFSLFIDAVMMQKFINEMPHAEFLNNKLNNSNKPHKDYIDSNSLILIFSLKEKSIFDVSFEEYLKGISFKLLANFLNRNADLVPAKEYML